MPENPEKPPLVATVVDEFVEREIRRRADMLQRAVDLAKQLLKAVEHAKEAGDFGKTRREAERLDRLDRAIDKAVKTHDAASYTALQAAIEKAAPRGHLV